MARDQSRSGPRSSRGTASRLPITSIGTAAARSAMRSADPFRSMIPISPSTSSVTGRSMSAMERGVKAPAMILRTRVCSGGSLNTRLVVWCSKSSPSPYFGPNSRCLSEENACQSMPLTM